MEKVKKDSFSDFVYFWWRVSFYLKNTYGKV